jgi:flagellar motor switch protein FliN
VSWDTLTWRPAGADDPKGIGPMLADVELLKSALEEAVSTHLMAPVTIAALEVATLDSAAALPGDFMVVGTFEAVGHEPCAVSIALDPGGSDHLAGSTFDPGELGWKLIEAIDQAVEAIAGEGLQAAMDMEASLPADEPLVVLRITLTDAEGSSARLAAAMIAEAPAYVGTHVPTVKALSQITLDMPAPKAKAAPAPVAAASPEAAPAGMPGGMPAGYPGMPGYPEMAGGWPAGYPQMASGYPGMPGYPQQGGPAGYPQQGGPAGYPQQGGQAGYPQQGGQAGYPQQGYPQQGYPQQGGPAGYPSNVRPLTLEELGGGSMGGGGGSMDLLYGVNLEVSVEIGRKNVPIRDVLGWTPGSIVELDKLAGEKVDVLVNGHLIASGEVVVVEENFGVRITDVSARARRLAMGEGAA